MKTIMIAVMIFGTTTLADAEPSRHQAVHALPRPEHFLGLQEGQRFVAPSYKDRNYCNGGPCSLTGGPSGGPNQS